MRYRRRARRQRTGWFGTYRVPKQYGSRWQRCLLFDMSNYGMGLQIVGKPPQDLIGHKVEVEVRAPVGPALTIRLLGEVRHATTDSDSKGFRVGLEFMGITESERSIMEILRSQASRQARFRTSSAVSAAVGAPTREPLPDRLVRVGAASSATSGTIRGLLPR